MHKTVGNRHMRSVEGSGMGGGTQGKQHGHFRDFQVGLEWINGVEKIMVLDWGR